jgi:hypothetical protein
MWLLLVEVQRMREEGLLNQLSCPRAASLIREDPDDLFFGKLGLLHVELLQVETLLPTDSNRREDFNLTPSPASHLIDVILPTYCNLVALVLAQTRERTFEKLTHYRIGQVSL